MPAFVPGLELNRRFAAAVVRPILSRAFPGLPYALARVGGGSDVLGFDTAMSTDHDWGPRLTLFLTPADRELAGAIDELLDRELPATFAGYPVRFAPSDGPRAAGHWVEITTVAAFVATTLGFDLHQPLAVADWLSFPMQRLLELTAGAVYHDEPGELTAVRERFAFYPPDVWRYLLAAGWQRINQEEHLMPRAGIAGDELGAALIGARLIRDLMRLGFLIERRYAPYPKWLGTAFARLACAPVLAPLLREAQAAPAWPKRNRAIAAAGARLAEHQNERGVIAGVPVRVAPFHQRPFLVLQSEPIIAALRAQVRDPAVLALFGRRLLGGIDQISDNTDLLVDTRLRPAIRALYE